MFLDDEGDSEDTQRFKNLIFFKFWGTNQERDEVLPWVGIIAIILIVAIFVFA